MALGVGVGVGARGGVVGTSLRPLAGRGVEVGDGSLGFRVGLRFAGGGQLLVGSARRQGLRLGGRQVLVGYPVRPGRWHVLALVLIVRVQGPLWAYGGVWRPEYRGPVLWGRQVVLSRVVVVMRVCRLRVVPWHWWGRWHGLVVVVGVSVAHVMVWCGPVRRVEACGPQLCWGVVMMELVGVAMVLGHREAGVRGGGGVLVLLVVPRSVALRERRPLCGVDL